MHEVSNPKIRPPVKLIDSDLGHKYVEFPDDVFFMESIAINNDFEEGVAYAPVQCYKNGVEESHLFRFTAADTSATHIAGPIAAPGGSTDVTVFGSALSSDGILYLCCFNRNSILYFDLKTLNPREVEYVECKEIPNVPAPNDVCVDPDDETILYAVGGTQRKLCYCVEFNNATHGRVYKIQLKDDDSHHIHTENKWLKTLAGVEVLNGELWVAQLFNILKKPTHHGIISRLKEVWEGTDAQDQVWLADNIDCFDGNKLLCPAYSTLPASVVQSVKRFGFLASWGNFVAQIATAVMRKESVQEALKDPECSLAFSNTYVEEDAAHAPIRLIIIDPVTDESYHFEVDLDETRKTRGLVEIKDRDSDKVLGKRYHFNEQVTHASHMKLGDTGFIACVNFEQPRILLLEDTPFRDAVSSDRNTEGDALLG